MSSTRRNFLRTSLAGSAATFAAVHAGKRAHAQAASSLPSSASTSEQSIPQAAQISIKDLLDHGAHLKDGQKVLLVAYVDGLYGGDNLVDRDAIHWIQRAAEERGNKMEVCGWICPRK